MILKYNQFYSRLNELSKYNGFVFYGANQGKSHELINDYVKMLVNQNSNSLEQINCDAEILKSNVNFLEDHLSSEDIFGSKKIIVVSASNPDLLFKKFKFEKLIDSSNCKIIIKASELKKSSSIRRLFEKNMNLCITACYEDSAQDCRQIIFKKLSQENIDLDNSLINYLANSFKSDRNLLYQEIEKIKLFLINKKKISEKEFWSIVSESIDFEVEKLVYTVVSGRIKTLEKLFNKVTKNGIQNLSVINAITKHFYKILYTKSHYFKFNSYEKSLRLTYPPIFFKNEKEYIEQVKNWPSKKIEQILKKLLFVEIKIKSNQIHSQNMTNYILFSITKLARKLKDVT